MRGNLLYSARTILPYLWGFAAAAALDHAIDVQALFLPVLVGVAAMSAVSVVLRRRAR
jgi:hypothetical protein